MKNEITYTEHNALYYPDLALPEQTNYTLGKYANLRLDFMKKHRRGTLHYPAHRRTIKRIPTRH